MNLIVDTGPLVALLSRRDHHHPWIVQVLSEFEPPMLTCEAVISEACFLLSRHHGADAVLELLERKVLKIDFRLETEIEAVRVLMSRFANVPMSFADACLVRMTELEPNSTVITFDSDFLIYRRNRRQVIPTLMPS